MSQVGPMPHTVHSVRKRTIFRSNGHLIEWKIFQPVNFRFLTLRNMADSVRYYDYARSYTNYIGYSLYVSFHSKLNTSLLFLNKSTHLSRVTRETYISPYFSKFNFHFATLHTTSGEGGGGMCSILLPLDQLRSTAILSFTY